jgi:hypothetical protein
MMSAPSQRVEHGGVINRLGYAHCLDCCDVDDGEWSAITNIAEPICDGCGKPFIFCTPLVISGTATIEYPACRIF